MNPTESFTTTNSNEQQMLTARYIRINQELEELQNKKNCINETIAEKKRIKNCIENRLKNLCTRPVDRNSERRDDLRHILENIGDSEIQQDIMNILSGLDLSNVSGSIERTYIHL